MSFINIGRRYYNTDHIKCVIQPLKKEQATVIEFVNGEAQETLPGVWRHFEDMTDARVIPALPGFAVLRCYGDDVERLPVIAWVIDPAGQEFATRPVTVDGMPTDGERWFVIQPDDRVIERGNQTWESYEQWLAATKSEKVLVLQESQR